MNTRHQLDTYLAQARRRLQWIMATQSAAALAGALLVLTLLSAVALGQFAFADSVVMVARLLLLAAVVAAVGWYLLRLRALRRDAGAAQLEQALPAQGGRVATYLQESAKQPDKASVLLDLLAEDARRISEQEVIATAIPARRLWLPVSMAAVCVLALVGTLLGDGLMGAAAQRVWLGQVPTAAKIAAAAGGIAVRPGDTTVRRNQDLGIAALVVQGGKNVTVHVKFDSDSEWEVAPMEADAKGGFAFTLFAVREAAQYYVTAGSLRSKEHRIEVVDLPKIESLRLTYEYPQWTGLKSRRVESGGDISAVSGTRVALEVVTDKPLESPLLVINGSDSGLSQSGAVSRGSIAVKQAGHYRIATRFGDEIVPLTPDYVIDVVADQKPTVQIVKPGRDYQATSVEEVPVNVRAADDFRLEALELHYSVNGGEWRKEKLPAGSADIQAAAMLRLEELQQAGAGGESPLLVPGDLVSYYALAKDHGSSTQTDLFLIQVQPFERRFTQSQAGGGGGGGGGGGEEQEGQISQRQREVLLATWNLQRKREDAGAREAERDVDNARMLAEVQQTLADQAKTLVDRAKARGLTGEDPNVALFVKSLEEAGKAMVPAVKSLAEQELEAAVQHEQKALQLLLRAESVYRDIQVALQSQRGGGGGGGGQAGRDVSEMTELELDLEKNQYETESQQSGQQQQQQAQAEDEIMRRLRELARRQEQLAREAERKSIPVEQQRWQQEQLQREAEQLRQQLEQVAQQRSQQGGQQQGSQQQRGQQQGSQSRSAQSGAQQGGQAQSQAAAEAARQVAQAMEQMRQAQSRGDQAAAERAGEALNRAREQLESGRQQGGQQQFADLANAANDLAERQARSERDLRTALANRRSEADSGMSFEQMERLSSTNRQLQADLEALRAEIDATRRRAQQQAPRAAERLGRAAQELQESDALAGLARNARDIERGRGVQAATRDPVIGDSLQRLQQQLGEAADVAATESTRTAQPGREANAGDLLAELGELRRALTRAQEGLAQQNQRGSGQPGAESPEAREGQGGQAGGESGQQGQGGQGQSGQGGGNQQQAGSPGQSGANGGGDGGIGNIGRDGGGASQRGGAGLRSGQFAGGPRLGTGEVRQLTEFERQAIRSQGQLSGTRLQQLREQLQSGALGDADIAALQELAQRLKRTGADPMATEYQRMVALVNQLELAALQAQKAQDNKQLTRSADSVDDSRRYRDNVAEYYRRLGGPND